MILIGILIVHGALTSAEDKPVKVKTSHFVDEVFEERVALKDAGRAAAKAWVEGADKCDFVSLDYRKPKGTKVSPEVFRLKTNCGDSGTAADSTPYCGGAVLCEDRNVRFMIRDVFCKATSPTTCPSAQACALATNITRSFPGRSRDSRSKPTGHFKQDMRGWNPGDTNRYPWTAMNEREMNEWERQHIFDDTQTRGDRYPDDTTTKGEEK